MNIKAMTMTIAREIRTYNMAKTASQITRLRRKNHKERRKAEVIRKKRQVEKREHKKRKKAGEKPEGGKKTKREKRPRTAGKGEKEK